MPKGITKTHKPKRKGMRPSIAKARMAAVMSKPAFESELDQLRITLRTAFYPLMFVIYPEDYKPCHIVQNVNALLSPIQAPKDMVRLILWPYFLELEQPATVQIQNRDLLNL